MLLSKQPYTVLNIIILLLIIAASIELPHGHALTYDYTDTIDDVVDGDSFFGTSGREYRLADVSAPEWDAPGGTASTNNLESLILNKNVYIDIDGTMTYGRYVCVVYTDYSSTSYLNVNKAQWSGGYAQPTDYPNTWNPYDWTLYVEKQPPPPPPTCQLSIDTPEGSGTTNPPTGTYTVNVGETRQITATPSEGWSLDHWVLDGTNAGTSPTLIVTMNVGHSVKAIFKQETTNPPTLPPTPPPTTPPTPTTYTLTITIQGSGTTNPSPGDYTYEEGTPIKIENSPSTHWQFSHWSINNVTHSEETLNMTLIQNLNIVAVFTEQPPCGITFKITDTDLEPLEGVIIETSLKTAANGSVSLLINDQGVGSLDLLHSGNYTFNATKPGYRSKSWAVSLAPGELVEYNISLEPLPVDIQLNIRGLNGVPIPDILVSSIKAPASQAEVSSVTSVNGMLILMGVKPGFYEFEVSGQWIEKQVWPITVHVGETPQHYNVSIQSFGWLELSVLDEQRNTISEVRTRSLETPVGQGAIDVAFTETIVFTRLVEGVYSFRLSKDGYQSVERTVHVVAGALYKADTVVLVKTWVTILSENGILIVVVLAFVAAVLFFLRGYHMRHLTSPVGGASPTVSNSQVALVEPRFFGTTKGSIVKAIVIDGLHEFSEIKQNIGVSNEEYLNAFYELIRLDVLINPYKTTFNVTEEVQLEWTTYFQRLSK